jgi:hypothetical protein
MSVGGIHAGIDKEVMIHRFTYLKQFFFLSGPSLLLIILTYQ